MAKKEPQNIFFPNKNVPKSLSLIEIQIENYVEVW